MEFQSSLNTGTERAEVMSRMKMTGHTRWRIPSDGAAEACPHKKIKGFHTTPACTQLIKWKLRAVSERPQGGKGKVAEDQRGVLSGGRSGDGRRDCSIA